MSRRLPYWIVLLLLSGSLACRAAYRAFLPPAPAAPQSIRQIAQKAPSAIATIAASPTWASLSPTTATATLLSVAPIPVTPSPTSGPRVTPDPIQYQVFEQLWQDVRDYYLYSDYNGADWDAIREEFSRRIDAGLPMDAFHTAMAEMIERLGDDHSVFLTPEEVAQEEAEFAGENDYVGIGVITSEVPERSLATVLLVFPGSPAEKAGIRAHDNILEAEGLPILDDSGFRRDLLIGPEGSRVTLKVQTPGEEPRQKTLTRARITGTVPVPYQVMITPQGKRIGYVFMITFADEHIDTGVRQALRQMSAGDRLDGIILDNRQNSGGVDIVVKNTLSFFTSGITGYFVNREEKRPFTVTGQDINGSRTAPLVVLVGEGSASFGEIFPGILHDLGRAYLIGEVTDGNVEILSEFDYPDGSRAWIAEERFQPVKHPQEDWEKTGILPDLTVQSNWDEVTLETDPVIQAALQHFDEAGVQ